MKTGVSPIMLLAGIIIALACSLQVTAKPPNEKSDESEKSKSVESSEPAKPPKEKSVKGKKSKSAESSEEVEIDPCAAPVVNTCPTPPKPKDCSEVSGTQSGIYTIYPGPSQKPLEVVCDLETEGGNWTVFQSRLDGFTNFYRGWDEYAAGFGDLFEEFWLGNHPLFKITTQKDYMLRVELENFEGETRYAEYTLFNVGSPSQKYRLEVGGYSGDAGDSLEFHNGKSFSTFDNDNDDKSSNCAVDYQGAWWYRTCHASNLNGLYLRGDNTDYGQGINWKAWGGFDYSFKTTRMMIRPLGDVDAPTDPE